VMEGGGAGGEGLHTIGSTGGKLPVLLLPSPVPPGIKELLAVGLVGLPSGVGCMRPGFWVAPGGTWEYTAAAHARLTASMLPLKFTLYMRCRMGLVPVGMPLLLTGSTTAPKNRGCAPSA
jgi:hypothetical protein